MADRYLIFTEDFDFRWPGVPKITAYKAGRTFKVTPMVAAAAIKAGKARYLPRRKPSTEPIHEQVGSKAERPDVAARESRDGE